MTPSLEAWTGPEGSTAQNADWAWDNERSEAVFATTAPLGSREGMTISVIIPKGVLAAPSAKQAEEWFRLDWGGYIDAAYSLALVLAVYLFMWVRVGKDPAKGVIVVQYEPPEGFSPAALGYLEERGYVHSQLAATLVSLAVKGAVTIQRAGKKWVLHKTRTDADLTPGERLVFEELLHDVDSLKLSSGQHKRFKKAIKALKKTLSARLEREYFFTNRWWFATGVALSLAGFAALAWRARYGIEPAALFIGVWLTAWTAGIGTLVYRSFDAIRHGLRGGDALSVVGGLFTAVFSIPFVAAEIWVGYEFLQMVPSHLVLAAVAIGATNVLFYHLLERPTLRGRGVLDRIEGFKRFLSATEGDRMSRTAPPTRSPELFERFLPHAIALGLQNQWAETFENVFSSRGVGGTAHPFTWFDSGGTDMDVGTFASSLGTNLSSSLSSASSAPGSSSGGGGGSSGGGGGGGGGGW